MSELPWWTDEAAHFTGPQHRVWLRRRLGGAGGPVGFILHNPSTAGADEEDRTSGRGLGYAKALDASDMIFVNAATGIATDADSLVDMDDPIGPLADEAIQACAAFCLSRGGIIIAAWGLPKGRTSTKRVMKARFEAIRALGLPLHALHITKGGYPGHPLYLHSRLRPSPWL